LRHAPSELAQKHEVFSQLVSDSSFNPTTNIWGAAKANSGAQGGLAR
jgi:hypothetical protein